MCARCDTPSKRGEVSRVKCRLRRKRNPVATYRMATLRRMGRNPSRTLNGATVTVSNSNYGRSTQTVTECRNHRKLRSNVLLSCEEVEAFVLSPSVAQKHQLQKSLTIQ
jgi:hypothetical protein